MWSVSLCRGKLCEDCREMRWVAIVMTVLLVCLPGFIACICNLISWVAFCLRFCWCFGWMFTYDELNFNTNLLSIAFLVSIIWTNGKSFKTHWTNNGNAVLMNGSVVTFIIRFYEVFSCRCCRYCCVLFKKLGLFKFHCCYSVIYNYRYI